MGLLNKQFWYPDIPDPPLKKIVNTRSTENRIYNLLCKLSHWVWKWNVEIGQIQGGILVVDKKNHFYLTLLMWGYNQPPVNVLGGLLHTPVPPQTKLTHL